MQTPTLLDRLRSVKSYIELPVTAKVEHRRDRSRGLGADPGIDQCVSAAMGWLCRAQDRSTTADGGVARDFSLVTGWGPSYPETTGYIVPTFLEVGEAQNDPALIERGRRMLDWLVAIQLPGGGYQGGTIRSTPVVAVTFNTGQILLGLAAGAKRFGEPYLGAMHRAAQWLVESQDADGAWRKHPTPFAAPGEKAYETHVAWGLLEAAAVAGNERYAEAAMRNMRWALAKQQRNGWFSDCCLSDATQPLTHTIGYVLRGIVEGYRHKRDDDLLAAARRTAESLLDVVGPDGFIPGRLDSRWRPTVSWVCLTGSVQIAHCWLQLAQIVGDERFVAAARRVNSYVRRTVRVSGDEDTRGAVKGSFPVWGDYGSYQYLNWAAKFFVDANRLERATARGAR